VAQLCQHIEDLEELNAKVIIVTFGSLLGAQTWLKETCSPFSVLMDPQRDVYRAYGLERSLLRSWNLKTIWMYVKLLASGRQWRGIQGDSSQLGGDFIIDSNRIISMVFRSHDPTDRPPVITLIDVIRQVHLKNYAQ
jgi:hypothetical protein